MVTVQPIQSDFAATVGDVDLTRPLDDADFGAIQAAIDRYAVLVFPGQAVDDDQQVRFSRYFGAIEDKTGGHVRKPSEERLSREINDISNLDLDNRPLARDSRRRLFNLGNMLWHSDSSYRAIPAKYSLLSGRAVPDSGGDTEFADMRAAYDGLDAAMKRDVEDLICEHSLIHSRGALGFEVTDEEREIFRPVCQRLVRRHPASGRKSLYLSAHAGAVVGWPVPEGRMFLRDLSEHATQRQWVYAHAWTRHDLVMWDNRCTMHRARRFDETQVRDMRRTTVAGDEMTAEQAA